MVTLYLLLSPLFLLGGAVLLGIAEARRRAVLKRRQRATARADARVTEKLVRTGRIGERTVPCFIFEFPVNGSLRRAQAAGTRHMREGDTVTVFYDPDYPESVYIPQAQTRTAAAALYFISGCWLLGGVLLFIFGIFGIK